MNFSWIKVPHNVWHDIHGWTNAASFNNCNCLFSADINTWSPSFSKIRLSVVANIASRVARGPWHLTTWSDGNHFSNSRTQLGSVKSQSNKRKKIETQERRFILFPLLLLLLLLFFIRRTYWWQKRNHGTRTKGELSHMSPNLLWTCQSWWSLKFKVTNEKGIIKGY